MSYKTNWADITNATAVTSTPYTILETDYIIAVDTVSIASPSTILLPDTPPIDGRVWTIKDATGAANSYSIVVAAVSGADFIDNATSYVIDQNYGSVTVGWNAYLSSYFIISKVNPDSTSTTYVNSTPYTVLTTDDVILVDTNSIGSTSTINLPNAPTVDGQVWTIKDDSGYASYYPITVTTPGGATNIDATTSYLISNAFGSVSFVWSAQRSQYFVVADANISALTSNAVYVSATPYSSSVRDQILFVGTSTIGSAVAITLPVDIPYDGHTIIIKDSDGDAATNNITITPASPYTIDGASSYVINQNYGSVVLSWSNAYPNYFVVSSYPATGGGGGITTIDGDSGSVTGSTVTITGGSSGAVFTGSGTTLTESFNFLQLPATSISFTSTGYISFAGDAFTSIHEAGGPTNMFVGSGAGLGNASTLSGTNNCALGQNALFNLKAGTSNVAVGSGALYTLTTGTQNIAIGYNALSSASSAGHNMAFGDGTLSSLVTSGSYNIAIGNASLASSGGDSKNICLGEDSLNALNGGNSNICMGFNALGGLATGSYNVSLGDNAGSAYLTSESSNILLNNSGTASESNTLRIGAATGTGNQQLQAAYICGIDGVNVGSVATVVTESGDQLGTAVLTAGSGISITPGANTITIAASGGGGGITTLDGDSGSATGSTVTITGGSSGAVFTGSGATVTESFNYLALPATTSTTGYVSINGYPALYMPINQSNIFVGDAGNFTLSGGGNIAMGQTSLAAVTSGQNNVSLGYLAATNLTTGSSNVMVGTLCGSNISSGSFNTVVGREALSAGSASTGGYNVVLGYQSLNSGGTSGNFNTIICGYQGGSSYTSTEESNILLNSYGVTGDNNTLRIGNGTGSANLQLLKAFISGIRGITTGNNNAVAVLVDSADQLGTVSSSIRYKENVEDMGSVSSSILSLRPVIFDYIDKHYNTKQVGLIAEEVESVMPSLVAYGKDGLAESVKYHELPVLLLNELQKALKRIDALEAQLKG